MYFQVALRARPRQGAGAQHPEWKDTAAVQGRPRRRHEGARGRRREGPARDSSRPPTAGMTTDEFDADRQGLARDRAAPAVQSALHRAASTSRCSSCWPTCAPTASRPTSSPAAASSSCGRGPRRSTAFRPSRWSARGVKMKYELQRRQAGAAASCPRSTSSTTGRASRSASTGSSAGGRSSRSATPTATCRCCSGPRPASGPRFGLIVHHTDAEREYAYDRESHVGRLDKALDEAARRGWTVVDMKKDWKKLFASEK